MRKRKKTGRKEGRSKGRRKERGRRFGEGGREERGKDERARKVGGSVKEWGGLGRILLEAVWLFSFWFRDNRIHGISIPKRTHILKTEFWWRRRPEN